MTGPSRLNFALTARRRRGHRHPYIYSHLSPSMHRAAPSPRAMPPPRRSARLQRSPSSSGSASGSVSPPPPSSPRAHAPRKRARMRLSEAEELHRARSIEQVIDSSADETVSGSPSPSPVRRAHKRDQDPDAPAAENHDTAPGPVNLEDDEPDHARTQPRQPKPGLLLPFLVGSLAMLLAVASLFFAPSLPSFLWSRSPAPPLRLERALPLLTAHVRAVGALLPHAREMQRPALDHLAVRELRDAARLLQSNAGTLDSNGGGDQTATPQPSLADDLDTLSAQLTAAKMRALDLGVALWLAGRATHNELAHALAVASPPSSTSPPTSTAAVAAATRFLASSFSDLYELANDTALALQNAYTFGTTLTASPAFAALVASVGRTPRSRWLGSGTGYGGEEREGLRDSVDRTREAIRRAGALGRAARDVAGDVWGVGERLRGVFAADDPQHPPKSHADPAHTAKLAAELRAALEVLAGVVAQVQPDTG